MDPERWKRTKEILDVSLRLSGQEREEYIARSCDWDTELRDEIRSLIEAYETSGDLLEETVQGPESSDPMLGLRLGSYKIVEHLGSGGMGSVYRAVRADEVFYKEVAVKVIRRGLHLDSVVRQFRRERQIMAGLEHPNIAALMDGGSTPDGLPYFIMEFIRGKPIDEYCNEKGLDTRERLRLFRTVCSAVHFAHQHGVIHRDIKPGNILINRDGIPKLLDFGIAKMLNPEGPPSGHDSTITLMPALTPDYASPEQLAGEPVSEASDVYSLGVLLCELLSGKRPYPRSTGILPASLQETIPQPPSRLSGDHGLAGDLDNIVLMAVRREPERRYPSAGMLEEDIGRYLEGRPVIARRDSVMYRASKFVRRQKVAVISAVLAVAVPVAISAVSNLWQRWNESAMQPLIVPVTSTPGREFQPCFSPDGRKVAYASGGETGGNIDIFVQSLNGGPPTRFTADPAADVSPVWSPDGSRVAWLRTSPKETAVFISPAAGGAETKIAEVFPNDRMETVGRHLDWSPDGRWLAAADRSTPAAPFHVVLIGANDGREHQVTFPPDRIIGDLCPAFSPDGKKLAFIRALASGINDLYIVPVGGGALDRVTLDGRDVGGLAWTADSRFIVFSSRRRGNPALWRVPVSGGMPVRIPMVSDNATDPSFSHDGRKLIYAQFFEDANLWRVDTAGSPVAKKLGSSTQLDTSPQYSPDGRLLAFRSNRSGSDEIWVSDREGRNPVQLTHFGGPLAGTPRWSPDGREIAFDGRPQGQAKIFVIPVTGGEPWQVTHGAAEDVVPSWSHDGRHIFFASNRTGAWQVWRAAAAGGEDERQVTSLGGFAAFESPDGNYLYYAKARFGPGLWRKRLPDGKEELVLDRLKPGFWGYWAVVSDGVYFADRQPVGRASGIYFYAFAGKRVRQLWAIDKPLRVGDSAFTVSPDRRYLLYSQVDESGSDILMMEHYRPRD